MKFVPVREIHEIELSSRCNLACRYCPHPKMTRAKEHMAFDVFQRTMEHVKYLCDKGTQNELSITGIGEAILHPFLEKALAYVRSIIQNRTLVLATNGVAMTPEIARILAYYQVATYVSTHRPEKAGPAYEMLRKAGAPVGMNTAFVDDSLNWAGQVDWHVSARSRDCSYLKEGWAVVRQDGSIDACCMDALNLHPIAHVNDELGSLQTHAMDLCNRCHLKVPASLTEEAA